MDSQRRMTDERRKVLHDLAENGRKVPEPDMHPSVKNYCDLEGELTRMEQAATFVLEKFKESEAAGYRSKDRQFAIEILEQALTRAKGEQHTKGEETR